MRFVWFERVFVFVGLSKILPFWMYLSRGSFFPVWVLEISRARILTYVYGGILNNESYVAMYVYFV